MHALRIKMVRDYSISEKDHPVSERVLIGEVRPDLVLLAQQRHCTIYEDACAGSQRVHQDCNNIVKA